MELKEGKLILSEAEYAELRKANMMASPNIAGIYLRSALRNKNLIEDLDAQTNNNFYAECIVAYRNNNYEVR